MKKKIIGRSFMILFIFILNITIWNLGIAKGKEIINNKSSESVVTNTDNFLTMMLETEAGSGEYALSNSGEWPGDGYTFNSELSRCENGGILSWDSNTNRVVMQSSSSDRCYVYFDVALPLLADYIKELYTTDGENGLYYHDGTGSYTNASQEAGDNSYRFSGADPNNYVCFGSDAATCPTDNLYRIIGVFGDQVKLIKNTSIGNYAWDSGNSNTWNATTKPDIYTTLNATYYNTLGSEWQNLIAETTWQVGGMAWSSTGTAKQYYDLEVETGQSGYEETMKIGLMYVSDYGYAIIPSNWTSSLNDYSSATSTNWLYLGSTEWLISSTIWSSYAFIVRADGSVSGLYGGAIDTEKRLSHAIRPTFYLVSNVVVSRGTGSTTNPFVLNLG